LTFKPLVLILLGALASACGGGGSSPTSATQVAQVGGNWTLGETLTSVSGGDCVAGLVQQAINQTYQADLQISQTGSDLTARYDDGDTVCSMTGTAAADAITLNATSCQVSDVAVRCLNGTTREVRYGAMRITATLTASRLTGVNNQTWNVTTTTGGALPSMSLLATFTGTKR
jgi:hypothetical protein